VNAGARPGSAKAADPAALALFARRQGSRIVLACGPGEEANARATWSALADSRAVLLDDPPLDLAGLTALIALANALITADSGPRHLAQALGKPVTVLFGPTDPRHTSEHAANVRSVRAELDCSPCHREVCPLHGEAERACMRRLASVPASGDPR
jgi:heptosyltransferase-2